MEERITTLMRAAIEAARTARTPYGAALYHPPSGESLVVANSVGASGDPTAHAEVNAIRTAAARSFPLQGAVLISTCEPCPMCAMAAVWAGIGAIYYGATIDDAARYGRQVKLYCREIAQRAWYELDVRPGLLRPACVELFEQHQ